MKWVSCIFASLLPLSASLSSSAALILDEATAAFNIPKVPKVQNSDADGFPILPTVGSLLTGVSQSMQGLNLETKHLQEELQQLERSSEAKLKKQKVAYDQLLRKQEGTNQKIQAKNAERAKAMMGLRDTARQTQTEIKKEEKRNNDQRAKLKSLQDQLRQVEQATADALSATDDGKESSGAEPDTSVADKDFHMPQRGLSFLQVNPKTPSDPATELKTSKPAVAASDDEDDDYVSVADETNTKKTESKVVAAAQKTTLRSQDNHGDLRGELRTQAAKFQQTDAKRQASKSPQASKAIVKQVVAPQEIQKHSAAVLGKHSDAKIQPINRLAAHSVSASDGSAKTAKDIKSSPKASEHTAVDDQSEALAPADESQGALAVVASDSTQVLEEGVALDGQMAAGVVASLSSGLKMVEEQVHQSEARLKSHFQKAYRAGKKRHDALIKQSEALEVSMRSMQAQEQKLEASLTKLRATDRHLKQKINSIAGFLGKAIAPIGNAKQAA